MLTTPTLTLRATNGSPVTIAQGDENWTLIQNFLVAINAQVAGAVNDNSTLKMYFDDIGTANALEINPAQYAGSPVAGDYASGYFQGMVFLIKAANTNTGASTLAVASSGSAFLTAVPITIDGTTALTAGAIQVGQIFMVAYDATSSSFIASNFINSTQATAINTALAAITASITATNVRINSITNSASGGNIRLFFNDVGTTNTIKLNTAQFVTSPASTDYPTGYESGMCFVFLTPNANTGATTISLASSGSAYLLPVPIKYLGSDLTNDQIVAGSLNIVAYNPSFNRFDLLLIA